MNYAASYENRAFSSPVYEDRLQTVPDIEAFSTNVQGTYFYPAAQEVPKQNSCLLFNDEATPVKLDQMYEKTNKITPFTLNFDIEPTLPECKQRRMAKKKKTKRRSYLSTDLPEEIRNQRRTIANARERARVGRMASGYDALQKSLPKYLSKPKMRKVDVLNSALSHIHNLMNMLSAQDFDLNQNRLTASMGKANTNTPQYYSTFDASRQHSILENDFSANFLSQISNCAVDECLFLDDFS